MLKSVKPPNKLPSLRECVTLFNHNLVSLHNLAVSPSAVTRACVRRGESQAGGFGRDGNRCNRRWLLRERDRGRGSSADADVDLHTDLDLNAHKDVDVDLLLAVLADELVVGNNVVCWAWDLVIEGLLCLGDGHRLGVVHGVVHTWCRADGVVLRVGNVDGCDLLCAFRNDDWSAVRADLRRCDGCNAHRAV